MNGHNQPQQNQQGRPQRRQGNWHEVWHFCFGRWQNALVTITVLVVLAVTGVITAVINVIMVHVVIPIIVAAIIIGVLLSAIRGKGPH